MTDFATGRVGPDVDAIAPDGSEIRFLPVVDRGSMVHCLLPAGATTKAVRHRTVDELWYVVAGVGEVWRGQERRSEVVAVTPGTALSIPAGTHFQFRTLGDEPLEIVITTMPPWPGDDEAARVADHWPVEGT